MASFILHSIAFSLHKYTIAKFYDYYIFMHSPSGHLEFQSILDSTERNRYYRAIADMTLRTLRGISDKARRRQFLSERTHFAHEIEKRYGKDVALRCIAYHALIGSTPEYKPGEEWCFDFPGDMNIWKFLENYGVLHVQTQEKTQSVTRQVGQLLLRTA